MLCDSSITCMSKRICYLENRKYGFEIEHMRILSVLKVIFGKMLLLLWHTALPIQKKHFAHYLRQKSLEFLLKYEFIIEFHKVMTSAHPALLSSNTILKHWV